jgi:hypothetical protein
MLFVVKSIFAESSERNVSKLPARVERRKVSVPRRLSGNDPSMMCGLPLVGFGRLSKVHAMHQTDTDKLFRYAFAFIDAHRVDVRASGDLTGRERAEIEQLAGGRLASGQRIRILRSVANNPTALRYLAALLRRNAHR